MMFPLAIPQLPFSLEALWADSRDEARIKHEALAALMGIPAARLSDQLAGRGQQHLSLQRLLLLAMDDDGRRFLRVLCRKLAVVNGFDLDCEALIAEVQEATTRLMDGLQKRMAKAELREREKKEVA